MKSLPPIPCMCLAFATAPHLQPWTLLYRGSLLISDSALLRPYSRTIPRAVLGGGEGSCGRGNPVPPGAVSHSFETNGNGKKMAGFTKQEVAADFFVRLDPAPQTRNP